MFKNILVPTDLTKKSKKALEIAVEMAVSKDPHEVTLLHVIETIKDTAFEEFEGFYDKLKQRADKEMLEIAQNYKQANIIVKTRIEYGNRVREIVKFAHDNDVDLIVLSSHRLDKADPAQGWATISYRVGILAHCPVMMVKQ